ncbi:MAG TPA: SDR family NAD(P)-dependent oxidoreductase [Alcaligenes sp.]|nr:SDR family NAD(P)-dependent oxidoreductase [Alcaligenes sp.]HRL27066.1 SDR family NAD(P)-dependent oxidoreductase [Alcaligenes sp.]
MKTAVVTGASSGFGAAIARQLVAQGHTVIGLARRQDKLQALGDELGERFVPVSVDLTDRTAVDRALGDILRRFPVIDVLVNNAGLALGVAPAQQAQLADWDTTVATNISALLHMTHALLPGMVQRNQGHIINLGSTAGAYAYAGGNVYGASKAFVHHFSKNLRADLAGTAVRVSTVAPGLCSGTDFSKVRLGSDEKAAALYQNVQALTPDDVAGTIAWIMNAPAHMNVNYIEIMPVAQSFAGLSVHRSA